MFDNYKILFMVNAYVKQLGIQKEIDIQNFISNEENIAKELVAIFESKFNPQNPKIINFAGPLPTEYHDFITLMLNLFNDCIVRTNYFLEKDYISFKVDLSKFKDQTILPKPVTFMEIFVYSEDFEAIHLRLGRVSRGGLRWSDRKDDFRTEVLGLVKTQNTKNTVIVPVGSKGGFIIKKDTKDIETAKSCYRAFLSGCLDITDNVIGGQTVHPKNIVIYDGEDPYFVVAADKGTATFSDIANEISLKYGFWLGDAFASGGSNGYDHKKMGITAKGAWESVKRHFREIGVNPLTQEFTMVGIGDMSGDVFGNGLIYSSKAKLIFAFNHLHVFVDPNPDCAKSYEERQRLFYLPSSTWEDYGILSKGGKVYKRNAEKCDLTPEIKTLFGIKEDSISASELIKIALQSKYDLLWNGGIGTYFKAQSETDADAKDPSNDNVRINSFHLGARIVGEGGNLGFTQKGRVEYALNGGMINTDAIDNSAGVDCSDHEVNIKILLNALVTEGRLTLEERNRIIKDMTSNVERLVLEDNYNQSLAISLEQMNDSSSTYINFIHALEEKGKLDRKTENLSSDEEIAKRKMQRPDFAILLAYSKMEGAEALVKSNFLEDKYNNRFLVNYFPDYIKENFTQEILSHKLAKEIATTVIINKLVNRCGITFLHEASKLSEFEMMEIIKAYIVAESVLNLDSIFEDMKNSDYKIEPAKQYKTLLVLRENILNPFILKILRERKITDISKDISHFSALLGGVSKNDLTLINFK